MTESQTLLPSSLRSDHSLEESRQRFRDVSKNTPAVASTQFSANADGFLGLNEIVQYTNNQYIEHRRRLRVSARYAQHLVDIADHTSAVDISSRGVAYFYAFLVAILAVAASTLAGYGMVSASVFTSCSVYAIAAAIFPALPPDPAMRLSRPGAGVAPWWVSPARRWMRRARGRLDEKARRCATKIAAVYRGSQTRKLHPLAASRQESALSPERDVDLERRRALADAKAHQLDDWVGALVEPVSHRIDAARARAGRKIMKLLARIPRATYFLALGLQLIMVGLACYNLHMAVYEPPSRPVAFMLDRKSVV